MPPPSDVDRHHRPPSTTTTVRRHRHARPWGNRSRQSAGACSCLDWPIRQLEQTCRVPPHPCRGGGGYDVWFREEQLAKAQAREDVNVSQDSLCCWREHLHMAADCSGLVDDSKRQEQAAVGATTKGSGKRWQASNVISTGNNSLIIMGGEGIR